MEENKKVSICIPVYNGEAYIAYAIESALKQSYRNIEIVILDNASTDKTEEIVKGFKDDRIRFYKNSSTLMPMENWNKCMGYATGYYIKLLFADDALEEQCIEKMIRVFMLNKGIGIVFCNFRLIDSQSRIISESVGMKEDMLLPSGAGIVKGKLGIDRLFYCCPTLFMFVASVLNEMEGFIVLGGRNGYSSDIEFCLRILFKHGGYRIGAVLAENRLHEKQLGHIGINGEDTYIVDLLEFRNYILKSYKLDLTYFEKAKIDYETVKGGVTDCLNKLVHMKFRYFARTALYIARNFGAIAITMSVFRSIFYIIPRELIKLTKKRVAGEYR